MEISIRSLRCSRGLRAKLVLESLLRLDLRSLLLDLVGLAIGE